MKGPGASSTAQPTSASSLATTPTAKGQDLKTPRKLISVRPYGKKSNSEPCKATSIFNADARATLKETQRDNGFIVTVATSDVKVLFVADTGKHSPQRDTLARTLQQDDFDFALLPGDLCYNNGFPEQEQADALYNEHIYQVFPQIPLFACHGNHDRGIYALGTAVLKVKKIFSIGKKAYEKVRDEHASTGSHLTDYASNHTNPKKPLQFDDAKINQLAMAGNYYDIQVYSAQHATPEPEPDSQSNPYKAAATKNCLLHIIMLDSNRLLIDRKQIEWLKLTIEHSQAQKIILVMHHPIQTFRARRDKDHEMYGDPEPGTKQGSEIPRSRSHEAAIRRFLIQELGPHEPDNLFNKITAIIGGHAHHMGVLDLSQRKFPLPPQIIAGSGSDIQNGNRCNAINKDQCVVFFREYGYGTLTTALNTGLTVNFFDCKGAKLATTIINPKDKKPHRVWPEIQGPETMKHYLIAYLAVRQYSTGLDNGSVKKICSNPHGKKGRERMYQLLSLMGDPRLKLQEAFTAAEGLLSDSTALRRIYFSLYHQHKEKQPQEIIDLLTPSDECELDNPQKAPSWFTANP